jgi:cytoskeletal protein RodZ
MRILGNTKHKKRNIIAVIAILVLIGAGVLAWFFFQQSVAKTDKPENTVDYQEPTTDQQKAGDKAKEDFINNQKEIDDKKTPVDSGTPTSDTVNVTISSSNQAGETYQLRTVIAAVDGSGTCALSLSKSGQSTITQEVGTQVFGSYSVCKGFDIPVAGLEKGEWQVAITYKGSDGRQGSIKQPIGIQ